MVQLGVFASVTVGALALLQVLAWALRPNRGRLRRRMAAEFGAAAGAAPLYGDISALDQIAADDPERGDDAVEVVPPPDWRQRLEALIEQAGLTLSVGRLVAVSQASGVGAGLLGVWLGGWVLGTLGCAAGGLTPLALVRWKRAARQERFQKQLPGAFELMARVIRTGQSVPQAFQAVAAAVDQPLAGEFARCQHQLDLGLRPEAAFHELGQRSGVLELRLFVVAMTIQRQSGGNLSDVLERLALMVRARLRLRQQIRTLTAEGRLQSTTLVVLPFLTFAVMFVLNRQYAETLLEHKRLLLAMAGLMVLGVWWIRRIVRFEG